MTNYEKLKFFFDSYAKTCNKSIEFNLHDASYDKNNSTYLYENRKDLSVIDMDLFAQQVYTKLKFLQNELSDRKDINDLAMATVDSFVIDKDNEWFFIEFKNTSLSSDKTKKSVVEKAYQNYYMLMDLFFENKNNTNISFFDFDNPLLFAKEHITYILVISEDKNSVDVERLHSMALAGEKFRPLYMEKLKHYLFKDAYVYLPSDFEREFVNNFKYV